ncbi:hypothetical protein IAR50_006473 [Cryptococcus sp. DSM 104548]
MSSPIIFEDDDEEFAGIESMTASQWVRDPIIQRKVGSSSKSPSRERDMSHRSPKRQECTLADLFPSSPVPLAPSTPMSWASSPVIPSKRGHNILVSDSEDDAQPVKSKTAPKVSKGKQTKRAAVASASVVDKPKSGRAREGKEKERATEEVVDFEDEGVPDEDWWGDLDDETLAPLDYPQTRSPVRVPPISRAIEDHLGPPKPPPIAFKVDHPIALISDLDEKAQDFYRHHFRRGADKARDADNDGAGKVTAKRKPAPRRFFKKGGRRPYKGRGGSGGRYKKK